MREMSREGDVFGEEKNKNLPSKWRCVRTLNDRAWRRGKNMDTTSVPQKKSRPKKQTPWGQRDNKEVLITAFLWSGRAQGGG